MIDPHTLADLKEMATQTEARDAAWLAFSDEMGITPPTESAIKIAASCFAAGWLSAVRELSLRASRRIQP